jgi:hypothetical protein
VNNDITGGFFGIKGPQPDKEDWASAPYDLLISANRFNLPTLDPNNLPICIGMEYIQAVSVTGNKVVDCGKGIMYQNYENNWYYTGSNCKLLLQCNDFAPMVFPPLFLHDSGWNKMTNVTIHYNALGYQQYGHVYLVLPTPPPVTLVLDVRGNQFTYWGSLSSYSFSPVITNWTANVGPDLGWNTDVVAQRKYQVNNPNDVPNGFADTNLFRLF